MGRARTKVGQMKAGLRPGVSVAVDRPGSGSERLNVIEMPPLAGQTLAEARNTLGDVLAIATPEPSAMTTSYQAKLIFEQRPAAGQWVPKGSTVTVWLADGPGDTGGVREPRRPLPEPKNNRAEAH